MAELLCRIDTERELEIYRYGGLLPFLLEQLETSDMGAADGSAEAQLASNA